jgi:hypothetical protein
MGSGETGLRRAMLWGKRKVTGVITTDKSLPVISLADIDSGKVNLANFSRATSTTTLSTGLSKSILAMFDDLGYPKEDGQSEKEMLIEFQLDHKIISSRDELGAGTYGPKTRATLEREHAKYVSIRDAEEKRIEKERNALLSERDTWQAEYTVASKSIEMIGSPKRGDRGTHVVALQTALKNTGHLKVKVSGVMNTSTIAALKSLQKKYKLTQSGSLDDATREALLIALVEKA